MEVRTLHRNSNSMKHDMVIYWDMTVSTLFSHSFPLFSHSFPKFQLEHVQVRLAQNAANSPAPAPAGELIGEVAKSCSKRMVVANLYKEWDVYHL